MPRIVDRDARRAELARAFASYAAEHGFGASSYARLAAAVGCSVGTIQHYFSSRDDLVRSAFSGMLAERDARITEVVERAETARRPIRRMIGPALAELLPLDDVRRREHAVTLQLRVAAATDQSLAEILRAADADLARRLTAAVRNGQECGEVAADVDPATTAARLLTTTLGLALGAHGTTDHLAVLDPMVAEVFSGRCTHHDGA